MDCIINNSMFIRSNGNIVCWDDRGCNKTIQEFDVKKNYAKDVYFGRPYKEIRDSLSKNIMPHGNICASCHMLNAAKDFDQSASSEKTLQWLQVESSFACQLACPNCYPGIVRRDAVPKTDAGHLNLSLDAYKKIVGSLAQGKIDVKVIFSEGHGEPLLNPRIWDMIRYTKGVYPNSPIQIVTNSNFEFRPEMATCGVTQMVFSIDGVNAKSYGKYRVKGKFDTCYKFMADYCLYVNSNDLAVETMWKYVLFEHNDSEDDLQKLYLDSELFGVKEVLLVITQSGPSSSKFFRALCDAWELDRSGGKRGSAKFARCVRCRCYVIDITKTYWMVTISSRNAVKKRSRTSLSSGLLCFFRSKLGRQLNEGRNRFGSEWWS
jgi:4Fe-4S single cluster domain